jgi:hypothetical protein
MEMSFESRFDLSFFEDEVDIDLSDCERCPHRHTACWNAGRCLMEDPE